MSGPELRYRRNCCPDRCSAELQDVPPLNDPDEILVSCRRRRRTSSGWRKRPYSGSDCVLNPNAVIGEGMQLRTSTCSLANRSKR